MDRVNRHLRAGSKIIQSQDLCPKVTSEPQHSGQRTELLEGSNMRYRLFPGLEL